MIRRTIIAALLAPLFVFAAEDPFEGDPHQSRAWPELKREHLGAKAKIVFDKRVEVQGPSFAEDPMNVPITVRVKGLPDVQRVLVLVDRNPIRKVLEYQPVAALPVIGFRFKLEQASPVRAAVQTKDGLWHVGSTWVDSSGGGCTVNGASRNEIGTVTFTPRADGRVSFIWKADTSRFTDHFLSMREFKCLPGSGENMCLVPYPYPQPSTIAVNDLAWLEHSLLFMFKKQSELGAQLWNGVIWKLAVSGNGLAGTPQAVDLNRIASPPARTDAPPFGPAQRDDIPLTSRWYNKITVE
jgi:predicted secreted protein